MILFIFSLANSWNGSLTGAYSNYFYERINSNASNFRRRGIEARKKYVQPIGAWFSQLGSLNYVHHMWKYP